MTIHFSQRGTHWDSLLFPIEDNRFELTLQFRMYLVPTQSVDPFQVGPYSLVNGQLHDADMNQNFFLLDWLDGWWLTYRRRYHNLIEQNWSGKFRLVPNKPWYVAQPGGKRIAATIDCALSVHVIDSVALHPHFTYYCLFPIPVPPATGSLRPSTSYYNRNGVLTNTSIAVGSTMSTLPVGGQQHRIWFYQVQAVHEFGHVLGLYHVNGKEDDAQSYGVTLDQRKNVMGAGMYMSAAEARPWRDTLQRHLLPQDDYDFSVEFIGQVKDAQSITYWDDGVVAPAATAPVTGNKSTPASSTAEAGTRGPAGVIWQHMNNMSGAN